MIKAIIFDIGGVCYLGTMKPAFEALSKELNSEDVVKLYNKHEENMLAGKLKAEAFCKLLSDKTNLSPDSIHKIVLKVWKNFFKPNSELKDLINKLSKKYKIACLSNATDFDTEHDKISGFGEIFNPYLNSCDYGLIKPDKKFFLLALEKLNLTAKECVFIDDKQENVDISKSIGFAGLKYTSVPQLIKELKALEVKYD